MKFINFLILVWNWRTVKKATQIVHDPKSNSSLILSENLSIEQMSGVEDLEAVGRLLTIKPRNLRKELKELQKDLDK